MVVDQLSIHLNRKEFFNEKIVSAGNKFEWENLNPLEISEGTLTRKCAVSSLKVCRQFLKRSPLQNPLRGWKHGVSTQIDVFRL